MNINFYFLYIQCFYQSYPACCDQFPEGRKKTLNNVCPTKFVHPIKGPRLIQPKQALWGLHGFGQNWVVRPLWVKAEQALGTLWVRYWAKWAVGPLQGPQYVFATTLLVLYNSLTMLVQISFLNLVSKCSGFHLRYHLLLDFIQKAIKIIKNQKQSSGCLCKSKYQC